MDRKYVINQLYDAQHDVRKHDIGMRMAMVKQDQRKYAQHFLGCEQAEKKVEALKKIVSVK